MIGAGSVKHDVCVAIKSHIHRLEQYISKRLDVKCRLSK